MIDPLIVKYVYSMGVSPRLKGFDYICGVLCGMLNGSGYRSAVESLCSELDINAHSAERRCAWDEHPSSIRSAFKPITSNERFAPPPAINDFFCVALWRLREESGA